jgi:hypothetical protein
MTSDTLQLLSLSFDTKYMLLHFIGVIGAPPAIPPYSPPTPAPTLAAVVCDETVRLYAIDTAQC